MGVAAARKGLVPSFDCYVRLLRWNVSLQVDTDVVGQLRCDALKSGRSWRPLFGPAALIRRLKSASVAPLRVTMMSDRIFRDQRQ
jgi:hypothetical protein